MARSDPPSTLATGHGRHTSLDLFHLRHGSLLRAFAKLSHRNPDGSFRVSTRRKVRRRLKLQLIPFPPCCEPPTDPPLALRLPHSPTPTFTTSPLLSTSIVFDSTSKSSDSYGAHIHGRSPRAALPLDAAPSLGVRLSSEQHTPPSLPPTRRTRSHTRERNCPPADPPTSRRRPLRQPL